MSAIEVREALRDDGSAIVEPTRIVAGVLVKFVNLGKGWRSRLFVLKHGVLRYYRVFGMSKVDVQQLFDALRAEGHLEIIGTEASIIESKWRRHPTHGPTSPTGNMSPQQLLSDPTAEVHLQVARIRASEADHRKFYIEAGNATLRMKSETIEDRQAWLDALEAAKKTWEGVPPEMASAMTGLADPLAANSTTAQQKQAKFDSLLKSVRMRLMAQSANADTQEYVVKLLSEQHQQYAENITAETAKRRALMQYVQNLENQKRELETRFIVEAKLGSKAQHASRSLNSKGELDARSEASEQSDTDLENDDAADEIDGYQSDCSDEFYDCQPDNGNLRHSQSLDDGATPAPAAPAVSAAPARPQHTAAPDYSWIQEEGPPPHRRERLPPPAQKEKSVSLWAILKDMIGKDLSRVCLPVYFNEPLSMLQKMPEDVEYSELVDKALTFPPGSTSRLIYIAAFAVSGYASTKGRTSKPFNPLLGETYELVHQQKGMRLIVEKVVHHPTIIAGHGEGRGWVIDADTELRSKFWGRSIDLIPVGIIRLRTADGEEYQWNKVTSTVYNLIIGKLYVDHGGIMRVRNMNNGLVARMKFKEQGLIRDRNPHQVVGTLEKGRKELPKPSISGKWDEGLWAEMEDGSRVELWRPAPPPPDPTRYQFTSWAIQLNEITPGLQQKLAPTDCRLRPDQHYTELGEYDKANAEKLRLETKQRAARKAADQGVPIKPRWFKKNNVAMGEGLAFEYAGGYWESRKAGQFDGCRDIFGQ